MGDNNFDGELDALTQAAGDSLKSEDEKRKEARTEKHISRWVGRIRQAKQHDKQYYARWVADRKMARGETDYEVDTNLIAAITEVLLAFLYAKNPDFNARPTASVNKNKLQEYREFAKTIEIVVSRMISRKVISSKRSTALFSEVREVVRE
jgi:hypothetical protein